MSCLSWNCRGLGSPRTVRVLKDLVKNRKPSLVFLIETLSFANKVEEIKTRLRFDRCFSVDRVGRSGGLAVMWKSSFSCEISSFSRNHINVNVFENDSASWRLSCFYGFPERERRKDSWNLLRKLASLSTLPWCIHGDFNDLLYTADKRGNMPHPQNLLNGFRSAIEDCCLPELNLCGGKFTWDKSRGSSTWVSERLDIAFAFVGWWSKFPLCKLTVLHPPCSNHEPLILDLIHLDIFRMNFRFRFEMYGSRSRVF